MTRKDLARNLREQEPGRGVHHADAINATNISTNRAKIHGAFGSSPSPDAMFAINVAGGECRAPEGLIATGEAWHSILHPAPCRSDHANWPEGRV